MNKVLFLFFVLFLISCQSEKQVVRIGHTAPIAPFSILSKGYSNKGLKVEFYNLATGTKVLEELNKKTIDVGILGATPIAIGLTKNHSLKLVGVPMYFENSVRFLSKKKMSSLKDLIGVKIGVPFISTVHHQLLSLLKHKKIPKKKIKLINLSPDEILEAWRKNEIDVALVWSPFFEELSSAAYSYHYEVPKEGLPSFLGILSNGNLEYKTLKVIVSDIYHENRKYAYGELEIDEICTKKTTSLERCKEVLSENQYPYFISSDSIIKIKNEIANISEFLYNERVISFTKSLDEQIKAIR